ncbi:sigma-70 family RNA polymerase sigma factor [Streptomyces sp. NPDC058861]|uniref:sigma-70 family RNA polymerase sigma factor n=1 Tax=Streptomyces sp. NPDC058861 TaxID=3346653 RepID=UPI0036C91DFE
MSIAALGSVLTVEQRRVAALCVAGASSAAIARQLCLSRSGLASRFHTMRKKLSRPRSSRAVLAHALLTAGEIPPPAVGRPVPHFTGHELALIQALAEHSFNADIGEAIGVRADDVRAEIDAVVFKATAADTAHLIGLGHAWGLFGPAPRASSRRTPASSALTLHAPRAPMSSGSST